MNKVIQANLGGIAFTFDDEAYGRLDDYLARLDGYFRKSHGHNEIMHDIEARLAELFTSNLKGRAIVTEEDVTAAISTMGSPEDFVDSSEEPIEETNFSSRQQRRRSNGSTYSRYSKRLMRDPDDKKVGGVCSGLAAYFGIEDPLFVRVGLLISVFAFGVGVLPYLILWAVMPEAKTAGDKLAMRGEPIDVSTISRQVEEEVTNITSRLQEWGEEVSKTDWSAKFGSGNKRSKSKSEPREPKDEGYMV
jgi:phage shock protein C